jgi:predicted nucleic acid-binding protein
MVAPPLLWSEVTSFVNRAAWRGDVARPVASDLLQKFLLLPIERRIPHDLYPVATEIATALGWAKTYDAEYVALARIEGCRLLTADGRLKRGAGHLVEIIGPTER